jgi:hypothetical protein
MRVPGVLHCDLCGEVIADETRLIKITVPLTADLRQRILAHLEQLRPPILGAVLAIFPIPIPTHWTLETCGCVIGILPMLAERVADAVRHSIAIREAAMDPAAPIARLEDL